MLRPDLVEEKRGLGQSIGLETAIQYNGGTVSPTLWIRVSMGAAVLFALYLDGKFAFGLRIMIPNPQNRHTVRVKEK